MKSYDNLKAEMEAIQLQMVQTKQTEHADALRAAKRFCKEFSLSAGMFEGSLFEGMKKS